MIEPIRNEEGKIPVTIGSYLVHSYMYYILDDPVISDIEYDLLCKELLEKFDEIDYHPHKHLVSKEDLRAGSGYSIRKYPQIVVNLANALRLYRNNES